jgi:hypothetical protein
LPDDTDSDEAGALEVEAELEVDDVLGTGVGPPFAEEE